MVEDLKEPEERRDLGDFIRDRRTQIVLVLFISIMVYFGVNYVRYQHELEAIQGIRIEGIITQCKYLQGGFTHLEINNIALHSTFNHDLLDGGGNFESNNIKAGDSVSKNADSDFMIFYKKKSGHYVVFYEYEVGPTW